MLDDPGSQITQSPASEGDNGALPSSYHHQAQIICLILLLFLASKKKKSLGN